MVISSECADLVSSQPFGGGTNHGLFPDSRKKESNEYHSSSDEGKSFDDLVSVQVSWVLREGRIDHMAEIRLQADVKEAKDGQSLIDESIADWRVEAGGDEEVLDRLEELHGEEEEHARSELGVGSLRVDPPRGEQANRCKDSGHFH